MKPVRFHPLSTKLVPGTLPAQHIPRTPHGLDGKSQARVILVRAPAGFGKTTAMIECFLRMESEGSTVAWITLDTLDNDITRFIDYLNEAMIQLGINTVTSHNPIDLLQALQIHPSTFTLFIDDIDALKEDAALGILSEITEHLPRGGQVVLGSRSWPHLALGRLRARGHLVEVGPPQLRFSLDQTREFLRKRDAFLPEHTLTALHARCEGWPTGLSLASLAITRHPHAAILAENFSGSDEALAEYLAEDVLNNLPSEVRDFLIRTSILKQLSVFVCESLCPYADCNAMLEQLSSQGMFMSRIGDTPPTWTYHKLFASFLQSRLERLGEKLNHSLHAKASLAYEAIGRAVPAIDHAIMAHDENRALALLSVHAEAFFEKGRLRLLSKWLQSISRQSLAGYEKLQQLSLWAVCLTHGPQQALYQMGSTDALCMPAEAERDSQLALRTMILALQDRYADAYQIGTQALSTLPTALAFADSALLNLMANLSSIYGKFTEARKLLDLSRTRYGSSAFNRMYSESLEGILDMQEGRMRQASARFRLAVETTQSLSIQQNHGNAWAGVLHAYAIYESNDIDRAEHMLNIYLPVVGDVGLPDHMILSHVLRSRLSFLKGDVDHAVQTLIELEHLGLLRQLPRLVAAARLERSRLFMLQGNKLSSMQELERACATASWQEMKPYRLIAHDLEYPELAQIRWNACVGDARRAIQQSQIEIQESERSGCNRRALKLRLLQTIAQYRSLQETIALKQLEGILRICCQEGYMRLVLDESPWIKPLLRHTSIHISDERLFTGDPVFAEYMHRLIAAAEINLEIESDADNEDPPREPLTRKELHVLQLLAEGYSNSAIAEKLVVADTTVRTHLRHINSKLNASSRTQAVARARKLRLLL